MRRGVRIAVDVGDVRVGVAASDPHGLVASPVETVPAGRGDVRRIAGLVAEREALEVIVGLPRSLSGKEGAAAAKARAFAERLAAAVAPVEVRMVDERLTTVTATQNLRASGVRGKKARTVVDQAAAVVILQNALETERASGRPPGLAVPVPAQPAPGTGTGPDATGTTEGVDPDGTDDSRGTTGRTGSTGTTGTAGRTGTTGSPRSNSPAHGPRSYPGGDHPR